MKYQVLKSNNYSNHYKSYGTEDIGVSDIATLICVGCEEGLKVVPLNFGGDGTYTAYIVDGNAEIGEHYHLVHQFKHWLKIYDDYGLTFHCSADEINIFRAGDFGVIIQISEKE